MEVNMEIKEANETSRLDTRRNFHLKNKFCVPVIFAIVCF